MEFRDATRDDLRAVVRLLADDMFGHDREDSVEPLPDVYGAGFDAMSAQPGNRLIVALDGEAVIGCLQLTVIHGVAQRGLTRGLIEGVAVASAHRNRGVGSAMLRHAVEAARAAGCGVVALTSNAARVDARRFYERFGFAASHVGFKLELAPPDDPE